MSWQEVFDDTFFLTLAGIITGCITLSIRFCYRSKCKTFDCLGIHIVRDVDGEEKIDELEIENRTESKDYN